MASAAQVSLKCESKAEGEVWVEKLKQTALWFNDRQRKASGVRSGAGQSKAAPPRSDDPIRLAPTQSSVCGWAGACARASRSPPPRAHTPSFFCFSLPPALSPMCTRTTSIHKHVHTAECRDKEHGGQGSVRCGHGFEANGRGAACQKASRWGTRRTQRQYRAWGHSVEGKQSPCVAASPGSCARGWYLDMLS